MVDPSNAITSLTPSPGFSNFSPINTIWVVPKTPIPSNDYFYFPNLWSLSPDFTYNGGIIYKSSLEIIFHSKVIFHSELVKVTGTNHLYLAKIYKNIWYLIPPHPHPLPYATKKLFHDTKQSNNLTYIPNFLICGEQVGRTISNCNKVLIVKIGFGIAQCPSPAAYFQARNQLSLKLAVENINQPWFDIPYMFVVEPR